MVVALESLPGLNAEQLRTLAAELIAQIAQPSQQHACVIAAKDSDILYRQAKIDKLTHELATLKRWKFARSSEQLNAGQVSLLDETIDADIAAIEQELEALTPAAKAAPKTPPATQTGSPARRIGATRHPPRTRLHHLRLWLPVKAYRRRCLREAGLHTGRVHGGAAYSW